jgi:hypothetical protein
LEINFFILALMLFGIGNALLIGLFFSFNKNYRFYYRLLAFALILFALEVFREFQFVFGTRMKLRSPIEQYFHFKLLVPAFLFLVHAVKEKTFNFKHGLLIVPWFFEFAFVILLGHGFIKINSFLNYNLPFIISLTGLLMMLIFYSQLKINTELKSKMSVLYRLFLIAYIIDFLFNLHFMLYFNFVYVEWPFLFVMAIGTITASALLYDFQY